MSFEIVKGDLTKMQVDAIVNAVNSRLKMGGGVCGAIFSAAGPKKLQDECDAIGFCDTGQSIITKGYGLAAKYVIHTVGPVWKGGINNEPELLYSCYKTALDTARENGLESIAFPLISAGIFGYPKDKAIEVAVEAISEFIENNEITVYLVIFDSNIYDMAKKMFPLL